MLDARPMNPIEEVWEDYENKPPHGEAEVKGSLRQALTEIDGEAREDERNTIVSALREAYGGDFMSSGVKVGSVLHRIGKLYPAKSPN